MCLVYFLSFNDNISYLKLHILNGCEGSFSDLEFLELSVLGGPVRPPMASDVCRLLHLLQPLRQAQEPLAHLPQPGEGGAQLGLRLLQTALVGPPLPLSRVQRPVLDLGDAPGDHSLSAGQHRGEQRLAVGAAFLQQLPRKHKDRHQGSIKVVDLPGEKALL